MSATYAVDIVTKCHPDARWLFRARRGRKRACAAMLWLWILSGCANTVVTEYDKSVADYGRPPSRETIEKLLGPREWVAIDSKKGWVSAAGTGKYTGTFFGYIVCATWITTKDDGQRIKFGGAYLIRDDKLLTGNGSIFMGDEYLRPNYAQWCVE